MMAESHRNAAAPIGGPHKLIIAAFDLPDQSSHFFNEILAYKSAAAALGLTVKTFVPRTADQRLVAALAATPLLEPILQLVTSDRLAYQLDAFLDASEQLDYLWEAIEAEGLPQIRAIVFPQPNPAAIRSTALWLGRNRAGLVPAIFFQFGCFNPSGLLPESYSLAWRLAAKDLNTRQGHERVFFLADSRSAIGSVMRVCDRRAFLMPMATYWTEMTATSSTRPAGTTIYIHVNVRSGKLIDGLAEIVRRIRAVDPHTRFLMKFTLNAGMNASRGLDDADIVESVEILPAEQNPEDYLANLLTCSIAVLAYEPEPYRTATSGVFAEAVGLGKPVVVPADTWMAQELEAGRGAGTTFAEATPEAVAAALAEALHNLSELSAVAEQLAPALRGEYSSTRTLERMLELAQDSPDMEPRYRLGEEIDFSDCYDSRCFMSRGWSVNESWGVWTEGTLAELSLRPEQEPDGRLILRAHVQPFLAGTHDRLRVRVASCGQQIAEWVFALDGPPQADWLTAELPPRPPAERGRPLGISFAIDAPRSPYELGLSGDRRALGLGFLRLSLSAA